MDEKISKAVAVKDAAAKVFAGAVSDESKAYSAMMSGAQLERVAHFRALVALDKALEASQNAAAALGVLLDKKAEADKAAAVKKKEAANA